MAASNYLKGFGSDWAGRGLQAWSENEARQSWGLFEISPSVNLSQETEPGVFGRLYKSFLNSVTSHSKALFPQASVENVNVQNRFTVTDAPQEDGAFVSYNKVRHPLTATVRYVCDGSQLGGGPFDDLFALPDILGSRGLNIRRQFMQKLEELAGDTNLYLLRTPENSWKYVNITGYDQRRDDRSITLPSVDVLVQEVRQTANARWTLAAATKQPQGASAVQQGNVQPSSSAGLAAPPALVSTPA